MSSPQTAHPPSPAPQQTVIQAAFAYIISACTGAAVQLKLFDAISAGPTALDAIATQTDTKAPLLYRLLRVLEMAGLVSGDAAGSYVLTDAGKLLCTDAPGSMHGIVKWITNPFHFSLYGNLRSSFVSGEPAFESVYHEPCFQWLQRPENSEIASEFHHAMVSFSETSIPAFLRAYDFSQFSTIVDVGGGLGGAARALSKANPDLKSIIADVPDLENDARQAIANDGLAERCRFEACDFFSAVPAGGDGYFMKNIVHDWPDERALRILGNIRDVIPASGKLVLAEMVIDDGPAPHPGKLLDIEMIVFLMGQERSESEFRTLFAKAGFRLTRVVPTQSPLSLIEAVPV